MRQKSQKDWFVLCTKARQELKVLEYLNQLGIATYTPTKIAVKQLIFLYFNQSGEIIALEAKKCIVRLQMLVSTMSFQLK